MTIQRYLRPVSITAIFIAMWVAERVANYILVRNQFNEVYPAHADSIGIPLAEIWFQHRLSLILLILAMAIIRWQRAGHWIGLALIALVVLGYTLQALIWVSPLHYPIALVHAAVGALITWYGYVERRRYGDSKNFTTDFQSGNRSVPK
jgi:hypothetical protein